MVSESIEGGLLSMEKSIMFHRGRYKSPTTVENAGKKKKIQLKNDGLVGGFPPRNVSASNHISTNNAMASLHSYHCLREYQQYKALCL